MWASFQILAKQLRIFPDTSKDTQDSKTNSGLLLQLPNAQVGYPFQVDKVCPFTFTFNFFKGKSMYFMNFFFPF